MRGTKDIVVGSFSPPSGQAQAYMALGSAWTRQRDWLQCHILSDAPPLVQEQPPDRRVSSVAFPVLLWERVVNA